MKSTGGCEGCCGVTVRQNGRKNNHKSSETFVVIGSGTLAGTRTPDPLLRRQLLYPPELQAQLSDALGHFNIIPRPARRCQSPKACGRGNQFCYFQSVRRGSSSRYDDREAIKTIFLVCLCAIYALRVASASLRSCRLRRTPTGCGSRKLISMACGRVMRLILPKFSLHFAPVRAIMNGYVAALSPAEAAEQLCRWNWNHIQKIRNGEKQVEDTGIRGELPGNDSGA